MKVPVNNMRQTAQDLSDLLNYLGLTGITLCHEPALDLENAKDARRFAFVQEGSSCIFVTRNIEYLPVENRVAVLLHELSHLVNQTLKNEDQEVDTDLWIFETVPEAEYDYHDVVAYAVRGRKRAARNLQAVSSRFVERIRKA